jgi:hypothetical protein
MQGADWYQGRKLRFRPVPRTGYPVLPLWVHWLIGRHAHVPKVVILTVSDAGRSAAWYWELLGLTPGLGDARTPAGLT